MAFVLFTGLASVIFGLTTNGKIWAWGSNGYGQCDVPTPNSGFIAIVAGYFHSLGLKSDGTVVAWGWNEYGQCDVPTPNSGFIAISAGFYHSLGLKSDGTVVAWGWNRSGECDVPTPNSGFIAIAAGAFHNLGLKSDGTVVAWGWNGYGECDVPTPNSGFIAIAAGYVHSLALKDQVVKASIDIDPNTLNLKSKGGWITAYIELPTGYHVADIDITTVKLNGTVKAELKPTSIGDYDNDGILDLMVKFERDQVTALLTGQSGNVELKIAGNVGNKSFEGSDIIRVIK